MRRAVLDSSVLISAFLTPRGTSDQVLRAGERRRSVLCISHEMIAETTRSLRQKSRRIRRYYPNYADTDVDRFAEMLALAEELVATSRKSGSWRSIPRMT
jgi:predicted nucleic acid-binding protein